MIVEVNFAKRKAIEALKLSNTFFEWFYPFHRYVVMAYTGSKYFTILTEDRSQDLRVTNHPYSYPKEMFLIVDDSIPQDWSLMFVKETETVYSVQDYNIQKYSDIEDLEVKIKKRVSLFPSQFDRFTLAQYCDYDRKVMSKVDPYLAIIRKKQSEMNNR